MQFKVGLNNAHQRNPIQIIIDPQLKLQVFILLFSVHDFLRAYIVYYLFRWRFS